MPLTLARALLVVSLSALAAPQAPPDFSGQWTVAPDPPPAQGRGAPPPQGDMGSGWGSPLKITQGAKALVVEQTLFSRYDIQPAVRYVYALDGSESRNAVMIGHATQVRTSRAAWDGNALRITTLYPATDPATGRAFTTEVAHRLSLESPTRLVIETTRGAALGGQPTATRTVYVKTSP